MKLLLITQKIDKEDDILGVYHEWARVMGTSFEKLSVICLYEGVNELPPDIRVFSLGKEKEQSRLQYIKKFYSYIRYLRGDYDAVLVHMNPIYVILGSLYWKLFRKKIFMWYAHPGWNWKVKLAYMLSDRVVTSVREAFHKRGGKVLVVGQGIDETIFRRDDAIERPEHSILSLGRLSPPKRVDLLIKAVTKLDAPFDLSIVGNPPPMRGAEEYARVLRNLRDNFAVRGKVHMYSAVPYARTVTWFNKHEIFVNLSPTGYFDKTVIEAMACECVPIVSNDAYYSIFPRDLHELLIFKQDDVEHLASIIRDVLLLPSETRIQIGKQMREIVIRDHSLSTIGKRLRDAFDYE